jgi:flagellar basal-body rod modification protein FlgD
MATINTNNTTLPSVSSGTKSSSARLADNFDQFLSILTTQLKNQNPLDPLDTNQFTQQLVQFSGVEQQLKTNDQLASLIASNKASTLTGALGFVGARVTADGAALSHKGGTSTWQLNAARNAAATINITDANGNTVYSTERTLNAGDQPFIWDGITTSGAAAPSGTYSISVAARDTNGAPVSVKSEISGLVDSVDVTSDTPILSIGGVSIPLNAIRTIQRT